MSLRTRLIAGLLALAAVGLLLLAGVTYAEQRHFLMSRVDAQAKQAAHWNQRGPAAMGLGQGRAGSAPPVSSGSDDGDGGNRPPDDRSSVGPAAGTWTIVRSSTGTVVTSNCNCFGTTTTPTLPASVGAGGPRTIKATNTGKSYRVYGSRLAKLTDRHFLL